MNITQLVSGGLIVTLVAAGFASGLARAENTPLPLRAGPRPQTTANVPHVQIEVKSDPEINAELIWLVSMLPGVDVRRTVVSLPGAKGFWLVESLPLAHPEVIVGGREFAHVHPDGSLHASLSPDRSREAVAAGWAVRHPWADQRQGWEGFVMLYTPRSKEELDTVFQLIVDSYNFVTGRKFQVPTE